MKDMTESRVINNTYSIEIIDNGYVLTYTRLASVHKYAFHNFELLVNHLAKCFDLLEIGEIVSVVGSRDKKCVGRKDDE
jgi:hypothetical protein